MLSNVMSDWLVGGRGVTIMSMWQMGPALYLTCLSAYAFGSPSQAASTFSFWTENIDRIVSSVGIIIGGIWVYFHFYRGRTYAPRLVLTVSHSVMSANGKAYVSARIAVQNIGQSAVRVYQRGTTCVVSFLPLATDEAETRLVSEWSLFKVSRIFENVPPLEAGVAIDENVLLELPLDGPKVWQISARIVTGSKAGNAEWVGVGIAVLGRDYHDVTLLSSGEKSD